MLNLAAIVGPTASGKTGISIEVAQRLNAEIISCDSMQVYRNMDIGTAKANEKEQAQVPHHMIDVVDVDKDYSVAEYQTSVKKIIADVNARKKLPLMVGGTGLYYQAVVDDYEFYPMATQKMVREKWNHLIEEKGIVWVYDYLEKIDSAYAAVISPSDKKRIVRALEVYDITGKPFSTFQNRHKDKYRLAIIGLRVPREQLYQRIEDRVDKMIKSGLVEEVRGISTRYPGALSYNSMQALGYKQVIAYLQGFIDKQGMIDEVKKETRRFAKRQYTWFKRDKRIFWVDAGENSKREELVEKICTYIEGQRFSVYNLKV